MWINNPCFDAYQLYLQSGHFHSLIMLGFFFLVQRNGERGLLILSFFSCNYFFSLQHLSRFSHDEIRAGISFLYYKTTSAFFLVKGYYFKEVSYIYNAISEAYRLLVFSWGDFFCKGKLSDLVFIFGYNLYISSGVNGTFVSSSFYQYIYPIFLSFSPRNVLENGSKKQDCRQQLYSGYCSSFIWGNYSLGFSCSIKKL